MHKFRKQSALLPDIHVAQITLTMANVRDPLGLVQGLIVGRLLSSTVAPLGWPKWLWYTGVIGRSHYNSRGRGVCSLASLYGYESGC